MKEDRFVTLQTICLSKKILDRQPFEHHRCGLLEADRLRDLDDGGSRHRARLSVGADRALRIRDAIAFLQAHHFRADRIDDAGAFEAKAVWQRVRIQAGAVVNVDEIQTDRVLTDSHLARPRIGHVGFDQFNDFGTAVRADHDRFRLHVTSSFDTGTLPARVNT